MMTRGYSVVCTPGSFSNGADLRVFLSFLIKCLAAFIHCAWTSGVTPQHV